MPLAFSAQRLLASHFALSARWAVHVQRESSHAITRQGVVPPFLHSMVN